MLPRRIVQGFGQAVGIVTFAVIRDLIDDGASRRVTEPCIHNMIYRVPRDPQRSHPYFTELARKRTRTEPSTTWNSRIYVFSCKGELSAGWLSLVCVALQARNACSS